MNPRILLDDIRNRSSGVPLESRLTKLIPSLKAVGIAVPLTIMMTTLAVDQGSEVLERRSAMPKIELQGGEYKIVGIGREILAAPNNMLNNAITKLRDVGRGLDESLLGVPSRQSAEVNAISKEQLMREAAQNGLAAKASAEHAEAVRMAVERESPETSVTDMAAIAEASKKMGVVNANPELPSSNIDVEGIMQDPTNLQSYRGFDPKAAEYFLGQSKSLGETAQIVPYERSVLGTTSKGVMLTNENGESFVLSVRDTGPEAGMTAVNALGADGRLQRDSDVPNSVVFQDGKLRSINFGKAAEAPSYSDMSGDVPTSATFNEQGQVTTLILGDSELGSRHLMYREDGSLEAVHSAEPGGVGGSTKFDSNGTVDPDSTRSVMREAYQDIDPQTLLSNMTPKLEQNGLAGHIEQIDVSANLFQ